MTASITSLPMSADDNTTISDRTMQYVERYRSFTRKSAESVIELARTLVEAEETLDALELPAFFRAICVDQNGSVYKKLKVIAGAATRFENHMDRLPIAWTSIYLLAKLSPDEFDRIAQSDLLSPHVTACKINRAVNPVASPTKNKKAQSKKQPNTLTAFFDMSDADDALVACFHERVKLFADELGIHVRITRDLSDRIEEAKEQAPQADDRLQEAA